MIVLLCYIMHGVGLDSCLLFTLVTLTAIVLACKLEIAQELWVASLLGDGLGSLGLFDAVAVGLGRVVVCACVLLLLLSKCSVVY
jgi:hypothetical protein